MIPPEAARLRQDLAASCGRSTEEIRLVRSPYRVCPLGAHIDHQGGTVTAMAIDRAVWFAYVPGESPSVLLGSHSFAGNVRFDLNAVPDAIDGDWGNYARGAVRALHNAGYRLERGLTGLTVGHLGEGGLSSSAAIGVAYLLALEEANDLAVTPEENVDLDQAIENGYLGLRNGILDPSAILLSRRDHLTVIDCARRSHRCVPRRPAGDRVSFLIAFSGLREALVNTDYNRRVDECRDAARALLAAAGRSGDAPVLGDVTAAEYEAHARQLPTVPARRAAHFFTEMERVNEGIQAWHRGDLPRLGQLMTASGASSIHNYECGAEPLIDLYQILIETPGVLGARFSGAGFRGCCVALLDPAVSDPDAVTATLGTVHRRYAERQPELASQAAPAMVCHSDQGAGHVVD